MHFALRGADEGHEDVAWAVALEHAFCERLEVRVVVDDFAIDDGDEVAGVFVRDAFAIPFVPAYVRAEVGCDLRVFRVALALPDGAGERLGYEARERHAALGCGGFGFAHDVGGQSPQVDWFFRGAARHDHIDNIRGQDGQVVRFNLRSAFGPGDFVVGMREGGPRASRTTSIVGAISRSRFRSWALDLTQTEPNPPVQTLSVSTSLEINLAESIMKIKFKNNSPKNCRRLLLCSVRLAYDRRISEVAG